MAIEDSPTKHLDEIQRFRVERLFNLGHGELSVDEAQLFDHLIMAKSYIKKGRPLPPLLLLELFIMTHASGHPQLSFVMDWLYHGAIEFHKSGGEEHFERGLGFTAGPGRRSGQGHEFSNALRKQRIGRERLFAWIRMLNKFEGYTVEEATGIVHDIHTLERGDKKTHDRGGLTYETLSREYKAWKGKADFNEEIDAYKSAWEKNRPEREELYRYMKNKGVFIPAPKSRKR